MHSHTTTVSHIIKQIPDVLDRVEQISYKLYGELLNTASLLINAAVRTNTVKLIVLLRSYVGGGLLDMLKDVKSSTREIIDKEIAKQGDVAPPAPTRTIKCEVPAASDGGAVGGLPRADISGAITSKLLEDMQDSNWKVRGAALDAVDKIIVDAGKRIQSDVSELPRCLAVVLTKKPSKVPELVFSHE